MHRPAKQKSCAGVGHTCARSYSSRFAATWAGSSSSGLMGVPVSALSAVLPVLEGAARPFRVDPKPRARFAGGAPLSMTALGTGGTFLSRLTAPPTE